MNDEALRINFSRNLRYSCSFFKSVSAVSRKLAINRQQFELYITGKVFPSRSTMKKICDFFGVEENEITLPEDTYKAVFMGRRTKGGLRDIISSSIEQLVGDFEVYRRELRNYLGYYYCCYYSCGRPGYIIRSLVKIEEKDGLFFVVTLDRLVDPNNRDVSNFLFRRNGVLFKNTSRLIIYDLEPRVGRTPSMTILFPTNRNRVTVLTGVHTTISGGFSQKPFSTRIVYQFIGIKPNVREHLRRCGVFHRDSDEISPEIKVRIENSIAAGSYVLTPHE